MIWGKKMEWDCFSFARTYLGIAQHSIPNSRKLACQMKSLFSLPSPESTQLQSIYPPLQLFPRAHSSNRDGRNNFRMSYLSWRNTLKKQTAIIASTIFVYWNDFLNDAIKMLTTFPKEKKINCTFSMQRSNYSQWKEFFIISRNKIYMFNYIQYQI